MPPSTRTYTITVHAPRDVDGFVRKAVIYHANRIAQVIDDGTSPFDVAVVEGTIEGKYLDGDAIEAWGRP